MIEEATAADLAKILQLQRAAFQEEAEHVKDPNIKPMSQTLEELQDELSVGTILKYTENGEILGSVRAKVMGDTCYIGRLVVHPDHWRRGIGRKLMKEIEGRFDTVRRYELFTRVDHLRTRPFYRSLGYSPFRTERHSETLSFVYLQKDNPNFSDEHLQGACGKRAREK
jgi:GNAT superfamily N-acetyltransferase